MLGASVDQVQVVARQVDQEHAVCRSTVTDIYKHQGGARQETGYSGPYRGR